MKKLVIKYARLLACLFTLVVSLVLLSKIAPYKLKLSGYTTLSLTKATFESYNDFFNGPVWILTVAQGGTGQYAVGTISKEDVGEMSGKQPEHDLTIEITYSKFDWEYPINVYSSLKPVYHYTMKTWTCLFFPSEDDAIKNCGSNAIAYGKFKFSFTCFCIARTTIATVASIDNCQFHTVSTIKVEAKGETYEKTFDSKGQISGYVGPYVYVIWNGNLVKQNCPDLSSSYVAFYYNGWKVGYKSLYDEYLSKNNYLESIIESEDYKDENTLKNLIDTINTKASNFISTIAYVYDSIETGGETPFVIINADDAQVPVYTFYVKATWLGIYQPSPKPKIIYATGSTFNSGDYGYIYAEIENDGERGNIQVWAECDPPVYVVDSTKTVTLDKGERTGVTIRVTANVNEDTTVKCKVFASSVSSEDYDVVEVTAKKLYICNDGDMICKDNSIYICSNGDWELYETCGYDSYCAYRFGTPTCIGKEQPPNPIDKIQDDIGRYANTIKFSPGDLLLIIGIVAVIIAMLYNPKRKR